MPLMTVAIDGPAGAGKGTLACHLARIYHLSHLDTGLLYRAVAFKLLKGGDDLSDQEAAVKIALSLKIEDLKHASLRDEIVGNQASQIASFPKLRKALLRFQRNFAKAPPLGMQGVVLDGRDIGVAILPDAPCKIFVIASPEVRAKRRLKELHQKGINSIYEAVLEDIKERDARDQERKVSPLRPAKDAFILNTSELGIEEVVEKACLFVNSKYPEAQKKACSSNE